jgi:hypothetical protein
VLVAPGVFDQGEDDGIVILLDAAPAPELYAEIREAASWRRCAPPRAGPGRTDPVRDTSGQHCSA